MKKRWISLLLVLALALAACSVCAAAAEATQSEPLDGQEQTAETQPDALDTEVVSDTEEAEQTASTEAAEDTQSADAEAEPVQQTPESETASAEEAEQNHLHAVNNEDACEHVSFAPLCVTGGPLESGCYYLTEDTELDEPLCVPKNGAQVTLCLNGYTLTLAEGVQGCLIYVAVSDQDAEPSKLTVVDCNGAQRTSNYYVDEDGALVFDDGSFAWQEGYIAAREKNALSGGRLTGATSGAISVGDYNTLELTNVNIIDNEGRYGAGVVIAQNASALLDSCVIAGNRLTGEMKTSEKSIMGGGVYCAGTLELSGTTTITGNRAQDDQNNLWLDDTGSVRVGAQGLDAQARVGVSGEAGQQILSGYADDFSQSFVSDSAALCVQAARENGFTELSLQAAIYTLTLQLDEQETVTLEVEQGQSLQTLAVQDPQREGYAFDGWRTEDEEAVDVQQPLLLTADTCFHASWLPLAEAEEDTTEDSAAATAQALPVYDVQQPLTRQEAVLLLYRLAVQMELPAQPEQENTRAAYADELQQLDQQTCDAVCWALNAGLLEPGNDQLALDEPLSQQTLLELMARFNALLTEIEAEE